MPGKPRRSEHQRPCRRCGTQFRPFVIAEKNGRGRYCSMYCARRYATPIEDRFWSRVDKTPGHGPNGTCWIWTGHTDRDGYGHIVTESPRKARISTHRLSWEIHHGQIPNGLWVLHHCDNPPCVNPGQHHLFLGTGADNAQDRESKGRGAALSGEDNPATKLSLVQVNEIIRLWRSGLFTTQQIGSMFGVCSSNISVITTGRGWNVHGVVR